MSAEQGARAARRTKYLRTPTWHARLARWLLLALAGFLVWLLTAPPVHAQTLYQWREANGAAVYSQWPPRDGEGIAVHALELSQLTGVQRAAATRVTVRGLPAAHAARDTLVP